MKLGRNDPCWCGSGRKYKKCHLGRGDQPRISGWESLKQVRRKFSRKLCCVPAALQSTCSGRIVQAHTVSRSSSLKLIARDGHVYRVLPTFDTLAKHGGRPEPQLIGINDASAFTGFCAFHDRGLFSAIENKPFVGEPEQIFLIGYRTLCREWYNKRAAAESIPVFQESDRGRPLSQQISIQKFVSAFALGTRAGIRNSEYHKSIFDKILLSRDFSQLQFYRLEFDRPPAVMGSGGLFLEVDFAGVALQDLSDLNSTPDIILFSSFSSEGRGHFCFVWQKEHGKTCNRLVESLASIPDEFKPDALLRFMFEFCENLYLEPTWWEMRSSIEKDAIINRIRQGSPFVGRQQLCLVDDGFRMSDWKVVNEQKA